MGKIISITFRDKKTNKVADFLVYIKRKKQSWAGHVMHRSDNW